MTASIHETHDAYRPSFWQIDLEEMRNEASDGKESKAKLSQAVHQRWVSVEKMLPRFLSRWEIIDMYCRRERKVVFPLAGKKGEVRRSARSFDLIVVE